MNPKITFKIIKNNMKFPWVLGIISKNPSVVTCDVIKDFEWDFYSMSYIVQSAPSSNACVLKSKSYYSYFFGGK